MQSFFYSVIATTYNQPLELDLYLKSILIQTRQDFEILIADDGSQLETQKVIEKYQKNSLKNRIRHIWHEDQGYRKAKILNQAIRESTGKWIIFTDTDLLLHPQFIEDHLQFEKNYGLFMGRRVDLNFKTSSWIQKNPNKLFSNEFYFRIFLSAFDRPSSKNVQRSFRVSSPQVAKFLKYNQVEDLLGSNFSICRKLLYSINGFDESNEHYWGEDGDLFIRAKNKNAAISGRKNYAIQWHLWHTQRKPHPDAEKNYQAKRSIKDYTFCKNGLIT